MNNPLTVELTLNSIDLNRQRRERNLYVVLAVADDDTTGRLAVTHLPDTGSLTFGKHWTQYAFAPPDDDDRGLFLFSAPMPASKMLYVRMWVMASMDTRKKLVDVLESIDHLIDKRAEKGGVSEGSGSSGPLVIRGFETAYEGLAKIGVALVLSGDRQLGFVSMDQSFDDLAQPLNRSQVMLSGEGTINWRWTVHHTTPPTTQPTNVVAGTLLPNE